MTTWREFVKEVQAKHKITYKEAMKKASPLWQKKKKQPKTRMKASKKKFTEPEEVTDFPKVSTKKKERKKRVPRTIEQQNLRTERIAARNAGIKKRIKKHKLVVDDKSKRVRKLSGL